MIGFATAGMTAFYVFRAVFLTFYGEDRVSDEAKAHVHESPFSMTMPLVVLAAGAIVVGFLGVPQALGGANLFHHWLAPVFGGHGAAATEHALAPVAAGAGEAFAASVGEGSHAKEYLFMALSVLIGLAGIGGAFYLYIRNPRLPAKITASLGAFYRLVFNKYYIDEIYERTIVRPGYALSERVMFHIIDTGIIEGIVNGLGITARLIGSTARLAQSGMIRTYAFFMVIGFLYIVWKLVR